MRVRMFLPALVEAVSPGFRPIKYSLFPPLGLATLAGYLGMDDEVVIQDEHVEKLDLDGPADLVVIEAYVTSAYRAYEIADHYRRCGAHVCIGGLHPTSMPAEALAHADSIFMGPGEDIWPRFLEDFAKGSPRRIYRSTSRSLVGAPRPRRDLIKRRLYLAPNSIVVSRGCPHSCEFCYKQSFFRGGKSFYTMRVDDALDRIHELPGKHLFFLDDHLFGNERFAMSLFDGMRGMGRLWQAAGTVQAVLRPRLLEKAVACGLRSLFIGFETLSSANLLSVGKRHNVRADYSRAIRRLRDHGVMINASFVFGLDGDDVSVFDRTVDWAVDQGIETATFHVLTPYPGTPLHRKLDSQGRILSRNWHLYNTRRAVFRPARMTPEQLEGGYRRAYRSFYEWNAIVRSARSQHSLVNRLRHLCYTGGWKKLEGFWNVAVKLRALPGMGPILEAVLSGFGKYSGRLSDCRKSLCGPESEGPTEMISLPSALRVQESEG